MTAEQLGQLAAYIFAVVILKKPHREALSIAELIKCE